MLSSRRARIVAMVALASLCASPWYLEAQVGPRPAMDKIRVQEAMDRPVTLPFDAATTLSKVVEHLNDLLGKRVVLDRAALERLGLTEADTVKIDLPEGVRLSTGLKLLLDQVEMTYKVVPEDNLLILTDDHGAADSLGKVLAEIKSLHRDVHDLQDAVDDVKALLGLEEADAKAMPAEKEERPKKGRPGV